MRNKRYKAVDPEQVSKMLKALQRTKRLLAQIPLPRMGREEIFTREVVEVYKHFNGLAQKIFDAEQSLKRLK